MERLRSEIRLTPSSSTEEVLKASPEEQKRWAEDIARQSNAFATSEIYREMYEDICKELYKKQEHKVQGVLNGRDLERLQT